MHRRFLVPAPAAATAPVNAMLRKEFSPIFAMIKFSRDYEFQQQRYSLYKRKCVTNSRSSVRTGVFQNMIC